MIFCSYLARSPGRDRCAVHVFPGACGDGAKLVRWVVPRGLGALCMLLLCAWEEPHHPRLQGLSKEPKSRPIHFGVMLPGSGPVVAVRDPS